jgi:hypothetical protein
LAADRNSPGEVAVRQSDTIAFKVPNSNKKPMKNIVIFQTLFFAREPARITTR